MNTNFDKAKNLFLDGVKSMEKNDNEDAERFFLRSLEIIPDRVSTLNNLSVVQIKLRKIEEALKNSIKAIELDDSNFNGWLNAGTIYLLNKKFKQALECFNKCSILQPKSIEILNNRAITYDEMGDFNNAIADYQNAIELNIEYKNLLANKVFLNQRICDWNNYEINKKLLIEYTLSKKVKFDPWKLFSLLDDPEVHKQATKIYVEQSLNQSKYENQIIHKNFNKKIKLGYFSADFRNHTVSHQILGLFENHDRTQFEILGFDFSPYSDFVTKDIERSLDQLINVKNKTDGDIAQQARDLNIDIAIDLTGHTDHSKPGIFIQRAAPIQINYLGYAGSTWINNMDYIVADELLIPESLQKFYSEKIIYMPDTFWVTKKNALEGKKFNKSELGLPPDKFIYCCFNRNYKISPKTFYSWMKILKSTDNSILWLYEDSILASQNLILEAEKFGISKDRIIFAKKVQNIEDHLIRYNYADLFLDTLPYSAHTTASDALWQGLPVLTQIGNSFASRVSASLLRAISLDSLIAKTDDDFEKKAIEFAKSPHLLKRIRSDLKEGITNSPLYNSKLFTTNLEKSYKEVLKKYREDREPEHIYI